MSTILESLFQYKIITYLSIVIPIMLAITMLILRKRSTLQPMTVKRIILPALFMSTGSFMFLFSFFRISNQILLESVVVGLIFSFVLIRLSKFEIRDNQIFLLPSKFLFIGLLLFFIIRLSVKLSLGNTISPGESAGMFFILAFTTLSTWRIVMLIKFVKLRRQTKSTS